MRSITGATRVAGVIGDPVAHSLSPTLHNAAFAALGLNWVSVPFRVSADQGKHVVSAMRTLGLVGLSVTTPHKDLAAQAADEASNTVSILGAANCLVGIGNNRLRAENTDGDGFLAGLYEDTSTTVANSTVAVLGAGGAARAITLACVQSGAARILLLNRTPERAARCAALAPEHVSIAKPTDLLHADIVVNATTVGMAGNPQLPVDPKYLRCGQIVVDIIYNPLETAWLRECRKQGIDAHNGLSMLVHQAALAITHWTAEPAPIAGMRAALLPKLGST